MNKEQVIEIYLINSPRVVAEMLYDTIERYEDEIADLKLTIEVLEDLLEDNDDTYI